MCFLFHRVGVARSLGRSSNYSLRGMEKNHGSNISTSLLGVCWVNWCLNFVRVWRRCMNRVFNDYGVFHFVSQSFSPGSVNSSQPLVDDLMKRISTVIIDEDESDSFTIRVDSKGFHPSTVAIRKVWFRPSLALGSVHTRPISLFTGRVYDPCERESFTGRVNAHWFTLRLACALT